MPPRPAPLRVLVVTNLYPSAARPAFGSFVGARVEGLRRAGHRVDVAAITDDAVHRRIVRKYAGLAWAAVGHALRSRLGRRRYDVVEAHIAYPTGVIAWLAARLGGAHLVLFAHGSDVTVLPWRSRRSERLARWLFARADLVVANSRFLGNEAEHRLGPFRRPVVVASPGIRPVDPDVGARELDRILFVGRLAEGKGVELLAPAMADLRDRGIEARLTVVGDGPLRPALEAAIATAGLGDRVELVGAIEPARVAALIPRVAVVTVPSTRPEGLGLVALEGMAGGAIVVATAAGGLAETMDDGVNGVVIATDDARALADGLAKALAVAAAPEAAARMREAARATAAGHELDANVARTVVAFRALD